MLLDVLSSFSLFTFRQLIPDPFSFIHLPLSCMFNVEDIYKLAHSGKIWLFFCQNSIGPILARFFFKCRFLVLLSGWLCSGFGNDSQVQTDLHTKFQKLGMTLLARIYENVLETIFCANGKWGLQSGP